MEIYLDLNSGKTPIFFFFDFRPLEYLQILNIYRYSRTNKVYFRNPGGSLYYGFLITGGFQAEIHMTNNFNFDLKTFDGSELEVMNSRTPLTSCSLWPLSAQFLAHYFGNMVYKLYTLL